jgi:hypothetical protein
MDRSLTNRLPGLVLGLGRADPVDLAGLLPVGLAEPTGRVDLPPADLPPVGLRLADPPPLGLRLADLHPRGPVGRVLPARMGLVDPAVPFPLPVRRVDLHLRGPVGRVLPARMGLVDRVDLAVPLGPADLVSPAAQDHTDPVALVGLADRMVPVDLAARVDLAVPDPAAPVGTDPVGPAARVDLADQADRRRRRTFHGVPTIGVAPRWAAPPTRRTASAHPIMVLRLRPGSTGSAGMAGLLPEVLRPTGTVRRLPVAGTVRRLPVAGTPHGTGRRATSVWRRPISGLSITVASTPFRSSTRSSVGGASGSSGRGFRCTDVARTLAASGLCTCTSGGSVVSMQVAVARP